MEDVAAWRRAARADLIARRLAIEPALRAAWSAAIARRLEDALNSRPAGMLGFYWPFRGEFDPRALVGSLMARRWCAALPVVIGRGEPLEYREWTPETKLERGALGILAPAAGAPVAPTVVLAPLVGFDAARYRLGNGGGYFDLTLAALEPRPYAVGVGFELGRLETIHPQPHDRRMDAIVTEAATIR